MLLAATAIFLYYTAWTLHLSTRATLSMTSSPPRVWAIRIPVILTLLGSAVVGTFIGIVMINSNKKKAAKAKAAAKKKT
ncbi:dolichol phosphate-mannose biosynthesis regulatory [Penicillium waksmanii]|uniref:dolichol phosphate-mannose biosynthesis regulatory n=1 Tax=Penicillium waksmanii TaxID=69791 RepID=UPI00254978E8|nr:dolichol phosphate-mannose biosynthesis regulatory [Penicillium waksmanii]KAJ6000387.1 dolichol phosphate-mannose biosynthesis regulatory [Penicillium waksmanii]